MLKKDYNQYKQKDESLLESIYSLLDDKRKLQGGYRSASKAFPGEVPLDALLNKPFDFQQTVGILAAGKVGESFVNIIKSMLDLGKSRYLHLQKKGGKVFKDLDGLFDLTVRDARQKTVGGQPVVDIKKQELNRVLGKEGRIVSPNITGDINNSDTRNIRIFDKPENIKVVGTKQSGKTPIKLKTAVLYSEKAYKTDQMRKVAARIFDHASTNSLFSVLEAYNLGNAIVKLTENEGSLGNLFKQGTNVFGGTLGTLEATTRLANALGKQTALNSKVLGTASTSLTGLQVVGGLASMISAALTAWEAIELLGKKDADAAVVMLTASLAFGVSALAAFKIFGAASGPIGLAALLIGAGLYFTATLFIDTELERFFKHFLLSDHGKVPAGINALTPPMHYNRAIYHDRKDLAVADQAPVEPSEALARFYDLVVCPNVQFSVEREGREPQDISYAPLGTRSAAHFTTEAVETKFYFGGLLATDTPVDAKAYLMTPSGWFERAKAPEESTQYIGNAKSTIQLDERGIPYLLLRVSPATLDYYSDTITVNTVVLFALRFPIGDQGYFPYNRKGDAEKEMAYYLGVQSPRLTGSDPYNHQGEAITVEKALFLPLNELKNEKNW